MGIMGVVFIDPKNNENQSVYDGEEEYNYDNDDNDDNDDNEDDINKYEYDERVNIYDQIAKIKKLYNSQYNKFLQNNNKKNHNKENNTNIKINPLKQKILNHTPSLPIPINNIKK